jgi:hypothetical protein
MGSALAEGARQDVRVHGVPQIRWAEHASGDDGFGDRDALIEDDPGTYYLKEHYLNYP